MLPDHFSMFMDTRGSNNYIYLSPIGSLWSELNYRRRPPLSTMAMRYLRV